jgi:hypothetical protein
MNTQRKHEMGDGFYIITEKGRNGMGGFCWYNVELRTLLNLPKYFL